MQFSAEIIPCAETNQKVDNKTLLNFRSLVRSPRLISSFSCNVCDVLYAHMKPGKTEFGFYLQDVDVF